MQQNKLSKLNAAGILLFEFAFLTLSHSLCLSFTSLLFGTGYSFKLHVARGKVFAGTFLSLEGNKGECHLKVDSILFVLLETLHPAGLIKAQKIRILLLLSVVPSRSVSLVIMRVKILTP